MTTKSELIAGIADDSGQTKLATTAVLEALENIVADMISIGEDIVIPGIGKLSVKDTAARTARNPRTGEPVHVPEGRRISFKPAASLKAVL